jgi:hypothetical protein
MSKGVYDASKILFKQQAPGLTEVRTFSKSENYKTEWRVFPGKQESQSMALFPWVHFKKIRCSIVFV